MLASPKIPIAKSASVPGSGVGASKEALLELRAAAVALPPAAMVVTKLTDSEVGVPLGIGGKVM